MNSRYRIHRSVLIALLASVAALVSSARIEAAADGAAAASSRWHQWTLHSDNDLFAFTNKDRDYTAGVSVTFTDTDPARLQRARRCARETEPCADLGMPAPIRATALEIGLLLFTPQDLAAREPLKDDRPYASLLYAARSKLAHDSERDVAYQTTLTVGVLGLHLAEQVHRRVHAAVGATLPMGYGHQISDGGEPTFRYARSQYRLLASGRLGSERYALRFDTTQSVGFLTEANAALAFRWGNRSEGWWEFPADEGDYAGQPVIAEPSRSRQRTTFALTAGVKVRARLYNAFLQGQFRHSDVAYSSSAIEHVLGEAWVGVDVLLHRRVLLSYVVRRQTKELAVGEGSRGFTWAGLTVSRGIR